MHNTVLHSSFSDPSPLQGHTTNGISVVCYTAMPRMIFKRKDHSFGSLFALHPWLQDSYGMQYSCESKKQGSVQSPQSMTAYILDS
jgi:hypothetical protein